MELPLSNAGRRYGYIPSPPDHRDFSVSRLKLVAAEKIPSDISLDKWLGPVRDQGQEGSCTGQAAAGDNDFQLRMYDPRFKKNPSKAPVTSAQGWTRHLKLPEAGRCGLISHPRHTRVPTSQAAGR